MAASFFCEVNMKGLIAGIALIGGAFFLMGKGGAAGAVAASGMAGVGLKYVLDGTGVTSKLGVA